MSLYWVPKSNGEYVESGGVHAGTDSGNELFVARAYHEGAVVPGKLHVSHSSVYIPYNMSEVPVQNYEVLVAPVGALSWIDGEGGGVPSNAVVGGQTNDGETLYIGRVVHNGTVTVGKIHPSHGVCYFPYGGEELNSNLYEVLVKNAFGRHLGL
ncbi:hypothetical protein HA402_002959 [Bradysia odoriphaga]|nr:hypothetical protein HA402_002959 [Bradysia odoriphaga]